jgi:hypothetical protein
MSWWPFKAEGFDPVFTNPDPEPVTIKRFPPSGKLLHNEHASGNLL